jgi:hypothetical protein
VGYVGLDLAGAQAARQPEAGETSLEGDGDPLMVARRFFLRPTVREVKQSIVIGGPVPDRRPYRSNRDWSCPNISRLKSPIGQGVALRAYLIQMGRGRFCHDFSGEQVMLDHDSRHVPKCC